MPVGFSKQNYWSGLQTLLQGIFPTQGWNSGLPHCRRILYCLSHQGSPPWNEGFCNQKLSVRHSPSHMGCNKPWKQVLVVVTVHLLSGVMTCTVAHQAPLGVCSNSCPLSQWCYLGISFSIAPFSFCLQSFPASGSFPVSRLFSSDGQSTEASASVTVLPKNNQDWFPLGLTCLIFL